MADSPLTIDPTEFQGIVADAFGGRLAKLNGSVTITADVLDELKDVAAEAIEEAQKLDAAEKALDDAYAADQSDQETYDKGVQEAKDALEAAQTEYDRREKELLAKLADILAKILGIGDDGSPIDNSKDWRDDDQDPTKPKPSSDKPGDSPSSDKPGDSPGDSTSSDSPGQTKLSSDTATPTQQQQQAYPSVTPQQAQQQQQQPSAAMSPSAGMPQSQSPSMSLNSPRPRDRDKDKRQDSDIDRGVLPIAAPVATPVPIDRGTSGTGITTRDVSGKPSTGLSTAGQVPGAANANNQRGMGGSGGMVGGGAPIGAGSKSDTASKRSSKRFDLESLFTKRDDDDQSVNSGSLSRDSLAATDKAREAEKDRMQEAMRESVKRLMNKKAG
ncbi:hypothetical protein AWC04_01065 [Mycolicibacterium fallax]|uniref:Uncharacterized protein n=2 Tax=Mycolicibacterium fallax TaxID=1793 RepID=A0A1X1RNH0_MYCFA|nr:hypothetical protein AWC04_01065 [Mycolicibacterium fallax]